MKNILKKASAIVLSLSMMFGYITPVLADVKSDAQTAIDRANKTLDDLEDTISSSNKKSINKLIDQLQDSIDNEDDEDTMENLVDKLNSKIDEILDDTDETNTKGTTTQSTEDDDETNTKGTTTQSTEDDDENNENTEAQEAIDVDFTTLDLGDQFKDAEGITYTVDDLSSNIYVGSGENQKLYPSNSSELPNFEITYDENGHQTWRKYVKLDDLCTVTKNDGKHICEIMHQTNMKKGEFYLKRIYSQKIYQSYSVSGHDDNLDIDYNDANAQEISLYYKSYHSVNTKRFNAILQLVHGESEDDDDIIDTYTYDEDQITSNEGKWSTETDDEGNETTVLIPDIETLRDKNGVIYVSLRFVSESLGAEVKWVSQENSKTGDDDDVYIQFYDDKEYCKDINYTFTSDGEEKDPETMQRSLYQKESVMKNISLDGTYTYTDDNGKTVTSDVDWKRIYILLTVPDSYPDGFFDAAGNLPLNKRILWIENDPTDGNYLWVKSYVYGKYSSGQCQVGDVSYNCNLGEDVSITGIILYKGVPIPIELFRINDEKCSVSS